MDEEVTVSDKSIVVTGGGRGIGKATAEYFAAKGASVVVNDLGGSLSGDGVNPGPANATVEEIEADGGEAMAHVGDVTKMEYAERLIEDAVSTYGDIDTVVNFAGNVRNDYLLNMSENDWDSVIRVHLKGHFALLRAAGRYWRERHENANDSAEAGGRAFVAVSSAAARGNIGQSNYAAAKAGVLGLMRTGARELHRYDIRINAIMPVADTRMVQSIPDEVLEGVDTDAIDPQRVSPLVAFLVSDAARSMTGCTFAIGGEGVLFVSDPEIRRSAFREGGWTVESLADALPMLTGDETTTKTESAGLLGNLE